MNFVSVTAIAAPRNAAYKGLYRPQNTAAAAPPATLGDHLQRIHESSSLIHFQRNETLFHEDDPADHVYRILQGAVRLCRYMPDGRRYVVDFAFAGDLMGCAESPFLPSSAEAIGDVMVQLFPRACFDRLVTTDAAVRTQLLCHMSTNLLTAQQHLFVLGCQSAKERVASFLLRLADRADLVQGGRLTLPMNRRDIADHLGLTIETTSRMMSALRRSGVILTPATHQVVLRDLPALRAIAAEA